MSLPPHNTGSQVPGDNTARVPDNAVLLQAH